MRILKRLPTFSDTLAVYAVAVIFFIRVDCLLVYVETSELDLLFVRP